MTGFWLGVAVGASGLALAELLLVLWMLRPRFFSGGSELLLSRRPTPLVPLNPKKKKRCAADAANCPIPWERQ
jgi:hypothetical protein